MNRYASPTLAAACTLLASAALAQGTQPGAGPGATPSGTTPATPAERGAAAPAAAPSLPSLDRNRDGQVSRSEAASDSRVRAQFITLDVNRDGNLDTGEFARFEAGGVSSMPGTSGSNPPGNAPTEGNDGSTGSARRSTGRYGTSGSKDDEPDSSRHR